MASFVKSIARLCAFTNTSHTAHIHRTRSLHVPTINAARFNDSIHSTSAWGAAHRWGTLATETGMARLALNDDDREVRRWIVEQTTALGCKVTIDQMGNTFAVLPGKRDGPPTAIGSHLDTQPRGGRYDGVLGVLAGLEALRRIVEEGIKTEYPVAVINWTNEEGARFPKSIVSSGVWAGQIPLEEAWNLKEVSGPATQKSELERIGFLGETPCSYKAMPLAGHFELHIEQGPQLESTSRKIGIVIGAQAVRWYTITLTGRESHTGATPYPSRADALLTAAHIMIATNRVAKEHGGLASTGILRSFPGSVNTVPGLVEMSLDLRHKKDGGGGEAGMEEMDQAVRKAVEDILSTGEGLVRPEKVQWRLDTDVKATHFNEMCIGCVRSSAEEVVGKDMAMETVSGAGHDSCLTNLRCPTSMVFVPSKDGISHNPVEYTSPEDCAAGAQVILGAVLRFDRLRGEKGDVKGMM